MINDKCKIAVSALPTIQNVGAAIRRPWDGEPVPYFVFIHYSLFSIHYSLISMSLRTVGAGALDGPFPGVAIRSPRQKSYGLPRAAGASPRPTTYGYVVGAAFRRPWDGRPVPYSVNEPVHSCKIVSASFRAKPRNLRICRVLSRPSVRRSFDSGCACAQDDAFWRICKRERTDRGSVPLFTLSGGAGGFCWLPAPAGSSAHRPGRSAPAPARTSPPRSCRPRAASSCAHGPPAGRCG